MVSEKKVPFHVRNLNRIHYCSWESGNCEYFSWNHKMGLCALEHRIRQQHWMKERMLQLLGICMQIKNLHSRKNNKFLS
jgi:hypothetical protein